MSITRNPEAAARQYFDLIILGGGIYGAMMALESSLRGLSVLVLEKGDFGEGTSYNSLKTLHGGLRALQSFSFKQHRTFVQERQWFLEQFPDLVEPLPVLMPLYQRGLRRTTTLQAALWLDRRLTTKALQETQAQRILPKGRILTRAEVQQHFEAVETRGLEGGALWYDAFMPNTQRVVMEVLLRAARLGATILNYMPALDLVKGGNQVAGVRAGAEGAEYTFSSKAVVNATGPWSRALASRFDRDLPQLFQPSLAWNVCFDRPALSDHTLAIASPGGDEQTYFLHSWKGHLLAGTGHAPRNILKENPHPSPEEIHQFLGDLNGAIPGLNLRREEIQHTYSGLLPVAQPGSIQLQKTPTIIDHARHGGPKGLYSISGIKFTTSRSVAESILSRIYPDLTVTPQMRERHLQARTPDAATRGIYDVTWQSEEAGPDWREPLRRLIEEEAILHLDDLVLRRTSLGDNPAHALDVAPLLCTLFDWDEPRCQQEVARLKTHFQETEQPTG